MTSGKRAAAYEPLVSAPRGEASEILFNPDLRDAGPSKYRYADLPKHAMAEKCRMAIIKRENDLRSLQIHSARMKQNGCINQKGESNLDGGEAIHQTPEASCMYYRKFCFFDVSDADGWHSLERMAEGERCPLVAAEARARARELEDHGNFSFLQPDNLVRAQIGSSNSKRASLTPEQPDEVEPTLEFSEDDDASLSHHILSQLLAVLSAYGIQTMGYVR